MKWCLRNVFLFALLCLQGLAFAEDDAVIDQITKDQSSESTRSGFNFWTKTEGAYYFKSDYVTGETHMAKPTGVYDGVEVRTLFYADYKILTPLGDHFLLRDANVILRSAIEITPLSIRPMASVFFWPFPFLGFDVGGSVGSGWNMGSLHGLSVLNKETREYETLDPFSSYYFDLWAEGIFQFDLAAVIPGEWNHVVTLVNYQLLYAGLTGVKKKDVWEWQESENQADGLQYYLGVILAYQIEGFFHRIGVFSEFWGHFDSGDYGELGDSYDGDFMKIEISPLVELKFSEKTSLILLVGFNRRRSFEEPHDDIEEEPLLHRTGSEWIFDRVAFRWSHNF